MPSTAHRNALRAVVRVAVFMAVAATTAIAAGRRAGVPLSRSPG